MPLEANKARSRSWRGFQRGLFGFCGFDFFGARFGALGEDLGNLGKKPWSLQHERTRNARAHRKRAAQARPTCGGLSGVQVQRLRASITASGARTDLTDRTAAYKNQAPVFLNMHAQQTSESPTASLDMYGLSTPGALRNVNKPASPKLRS